MNNQTQIKCPNCGNSVDVQDILAHQLEEEIRQKYQAESAVEKQKLQKKLDEFNQDKEQFELKKKQEN